MKKEIHQLPSFVPQWIQQRVGADLYSIYNFVEQSCAEIQAGALVLDAGEGQYREYLRHIRYVGVDLAVGDVVDLIQRGEFGVVCQDTPQDLARSVAGLLRDSQRCEVLGQRAAT